MVIQRMKRLVPGSEGEGCGRWQATQNGNE